VTLSTGLVLAVVAALPCRAQSSVLGLGLDDPAAEAESTVVKMPFAFDLKKLEDGEPGIGVRLRVPVYFAWNKISFVDVGGDDIARSLKTLTVTPGVELQIPVGQSWLVRPFLEFGSISGLDLGENAWLVSSGCRVSATLDRDRWRFLGGGRLQYSVAFNDDWQFHEDLGSIELGAGASLPLWFDVALGTPRAGLFIFPRYYFDDFVLDGPDDGGLTVDRYLEIGASIEWPQRPKLLGIKLPAWYGLGYRFAENYGAVRVYLGFPF
jgi:hypothetical protein